MTRLIDADALREALGITGTADTCKGCAYNNSSFTSCNLIKAPLFTDVCEAIDDAPTVDSVRHGRWEIPEGHGEARVCSECGMICHADRAMFYNYCPNCGADVRPEWRKKDER